MFAGTDSDFSWLALIVAKLTKDNWFMDYIKEWQLYVGGKWENCL